MSTVSQMDNASFPGTKFFTGCNYWASHAGMYMWREWNPQQVDADMALLEANGMSVIRVFPLWPDFQPLTAEYAGAGYVRDIGQSGGPLKNDAGIDDEMIARFRYLCDSASAHNLKLVVGLLTGWMSGRLFVPPALESKNVLTDAVAIRWEVRFVNYFIASLKDHPAIVAWDLGNECNVMGGVKEAESWTWMQTISSAIRLADPTRPVVSGMHSCSTCVNSSWNLFQQGELMDVLTTHPYPLWTPDCNREPFDTMRDELHPACETSLYAGFSGKPAFVEEAGSMGPTVVSDAKAAASMRAALFSSWADGLHGYLWWCAFDQDKLGFAPYDWTFIERELGLFRFDSSPKQTALAMKEFSEFLKSLPFDTLPPKQIDAVCLVTSRHDGWRSAFGSYLLSRQAGFDIRFAAAENKLPESKFYILPSAPGYDGYSARAWHALLDKIEAGATALISLGGSAGHTEFEAVTGLEVVTHHQTSRSGSFEIDEVTVAFGDSFTRILASKGAKVLAADESGNPMLSVHHYGNGKVVFCNFDIEGYGIEHGGAWTGDAINPLWRVYAVAAHEAGVSRIVKKDIPTVGITEHPRGNGTALCVAINYEPLPVNCPIRINGKLGRVFRGEIKDSRLVINANDAAVFEVI